MQLPPGDAGTRRREPRTDSTRKAEGTLPTRGRRGKAARRAVPGTRAHRYPLGVGTYDAVIVVSFGGPEGPDDVVPFLENVTRGRGIPRERLRAVGAHYDHFGGVSPLNEQCRRLVAALEQTLAERGRPLPVYWGNRNWQPFLGDTVARMADDGVRRALAFVTSAYSSYSGCRQYLDDITAARAATGDRAPEIHKLRPFFDHPGFIEPLAESAIEARARLGPAGDAAPLVFTAHSIPSVMAATCDYETQLRAVADLVRERVDPDAPYDLVFQSRSGPPSVPWLEPDVNDHLRSLAARGHATAVVVPIGFVSDHMEVVWDLDHEAAATAAAAGMTVVRAATPGTGPDPRFVDMIDALIAEKVAEGPALALSALPTRPDPCAPGCCPAP